MGRQPVEPGPGLSAAMRAALVPIWRGCCAPGSRWSPVRDCPPRCGRRWFRCWRGCLESAAAEAPAVEDRVGKEADDESDRT